MTTYADFIREIPETEQCVRFPGVLQGYGYGIIKVRGRKMYAHRYSYEINIGPIPEGMVLDHLCRVRDCVNPAHLEPVTNRENILRGEGHTARNAAKTHCPKGHPYSGENLIARDGRRRCRACKRARDILRGRARRRAS